MAQLSMALRLGCLVDRLIAGKETENPLLESDRKKFRPDDVVAGRNALVQIKSPSTNAAVCMEGAGKEEDTRLYGQSYLCSTGVK